jgi:hypothetical protein
MDAAGAFMDDDKGVGGRSGKCGLLAGAGWRPATLTSCSDRRFIKKKPVGIGPASLLEENVMVGHRKLLPKILVKIGIKVKITIVRK